MLVHWLTADTTSWIEGGKPFNVLSLSVTVLGFVATLIGLSWTFRQSKQARKAAETAQEISVETSKKISSINALTDIGRLIEYCKELRGLIETKSYATATERVISLHSELIKVAKSRLGHSLLPSEEWQDIFEYLKLVRKHMVSPPLPDKAIPTMRDRLGDISTRLAAAQANAAAIMEERNANSK